MCAIGALCGDGHTARPWWPTEERCDCDPNEIVITDCCRRRLPARETVASLRRQELPVGGYGDYQEIEPWPSPIYENGVQVGERRRPINWLSYASYYDPSWRIECNPAGERSCKEHRRFLRGLHLRYWQ